MYQTPQPPHRAGQRRDWAEISDYGRRRSRFAWVIERRGCKEIRFSLLARDQRVADRFGDLREDRLHAGKLMSEAAERQMSMRGPGGGLMIRRARGPFVRGAAQRVRIEGVKRIARRTEQNQPPTRESELRAKGQSRGQSPQPSPKSIRSFRHLNPRLRWDHRSEQPKRRTALLFQDACHVGSRLLLHMVESEYALCWSSTVRGMRLRGNRVNFSHPHSRRKLPVWLALLAILIDALLPTGVAAARYSVGGSPALAICGDRSPGAPTKHDPLLPERHCALCCCCSVHGLAPGQIALVPKPVVAGALVHLSWSVTPLPIQPDLRGAVLPRGPPIAA